MTTREPAALWGPEAECIERVAADDGATIAVERFGTPAPGARVLVFVHGIGAYSGPYRRLARPLAEAGAVVYLPNLRGHGYSDGVRGLLGSPGRVHADIGAVVAHARERNPGCELVLGGESMGALITLAAAARLRPTPDRLLFLAPALRLSLSRIVRAAIDPRLRPKGLHKGIPAHGSMPAEVPREPAFRTACRTDPLMVQRVSVRYLMTLASMMSMWSLRYPKLLPQPALVMQGDADRLLSITGASVLVERLPQGELRMVEGAWHNLLWDPTAEETIRAVTEWLVG